MSEQWNTLVVDRYPERFLARICLNRPDKMNALSSEMLEELGGVFDQLDEDEGIRGVILTGTGERAFAAGADIGELRGVGKEAGEAKARFGQEIFRKIETFVKPVIAVVHGYALGGGAELAMACHLRIASEQAQFALPEASLGLIPGYGGTQRAVRLIGSARALEWIWRGSRIDGAKAFEWGLVNHVARSREEALELAEKLLSEILRQAPLAVGAVLKCVRLAGDQKGYDREAVLFGEMCDTEDGREGVEAFLEKRQAQFRGR
ncbi:MAG: enoyl-CoA hydratase-related protein [Balneolaceae bacterium]